MKEYKSSEDIYADFPRLKEIADRLALTELEANDYNNKLRQHGQNDPSNPAAGASNRDRRKHPEYFKITQWWSRNANGNIVPNTTPFIPLCGEKNFTEKLSHVMRTYKPVGIEVYIYAGRKFNIDPSYKETFWFDSDVNEEEKIAANEKSVVAAESTAKTEAMLAGFQQQIEDLKKQPGSGEDLRLKIISMNFAEQIKDMRHEQEKKDITVKFEGMIRELQGELRESEDYIRDLEEELDEQDSTLGSLKTKVEEKTSPPTLQKILAGAIENAGIGILTKYPKLTEAISGLTPEAQKALWLEYEGKTNTGTEGTGSDASFSEASSDSDYDGLTQEHKEMCQIVHEVCKRVDLESAKKIYSFFFYIASADGKEIVNEKLDKAYAMIAMLQSKEPQN